MRPFRAHGSYKIKKNLCRNLLAIRDDVILELDFNKMTQISWPAVKSLADAGVKVIPVDRRENTFIGVTANGRIFTQYRGERSFADLNFSKTFNDVILTRCRRVFRIQAGPEPLQPLLETKIPKEEVIDIFAEQKAVLLRNVGGFKLYYPDTQTYKTSENVRVVGNLIATYGKSGFCHGCRYVMAGGKAFVKFSVATNGIFDLETLYVNSAGTVETLVVELTRHRIVFEMTLPSGERKLMSMNPYWNVPDVCRILPGKFEEDSVD